MSNTTNKSYPQTHSLFSITKVEFILSSYCVVAAMDTTEDAGEEQPSPRPQHQGQELDIQQVFVVKFTFMHSLYQNQDLNIIQYLIEYRRGKTEFRHG